MPEDKYVVERYIEQVEHYGDDHSDGGIADAFEKLLAKTEEHEGYESDDAREQVWSCSLCNSIFLPHLTQKRGESKKYAAGEHCKQKAKDKSVEQKASDATMVILYIRLAYERGDAHHGAYGKDHESEEHAIGKRHGSKVCGGVVPDHNTVDETYKSAAKLREHDGESEAQVAPIIWQVVAKSQ